MLKNGKMCVETAQNRSSPNRIAKVFIEIRIIIPVILKEIAISLKIVTCRLFNKICLVENICKISIQKKAKVTKIHRFMIPKLEDTMKKFCQKIGQTGKKKRNETNLLKQLGIYVSLVNNGYTCDHTFGKKRIGALLDAGA